MKSRKLSSKAGFTLVELMVVAIIVALLAAVAIPLMSANKKRAAATEGEAGLGTIRSALRAVYAEKGVYNQNLNGGAINVAAVAGNVPGISVGDLNGKYFVDANYTVASISASNYSIQVVGTTGVVNGVTITLNQDGTFGYTGL
jgi:prepilin-type N-terminal cleavage/methylation domain-containing protein